MHDPPDTGDSISERPQTSHAPEPERRGTLLARVTDLHLHFDTDRGAVKALDGVNFDIHQDELFALVGETGCGKTVTARSFMQLVPTPPGRYPSGEIQMRSDRPCPRCEGAGCAHCHESGVEFDDLLSLSTSEMEAFRGDRISMIFQDPQTTLNPSLPIRTHLAESILAHHREEILEEAGVDLETTGLAMGRVLRNRASAERTPLYTLLAKLPPFRSHTTDIRRVLTERSIELLYQTQVPNPREVLDNYAHELSGGQQQRVMIAMALAAEPDLLIADEATTALDVTTQARILKLIKDLQEEYNTGLLYITHDLNLVHEIADRVAVMYAGSIAEMGDVDDIYEDPKHPYTQGLINSVPREEMVGEQLEGIDGTIPNLVNPPKGCRFCTRCPDVMDHCSEIDPPVISDGAGREVACHLYEDEAEAYEDDTGTQPPSTHQR